MKKFLIATLVGLMTTASVASAQTIVFEHNFENATPGDLSAAGTLGTPSFGTLEATGGVISTTRPAYTTGNNGASNSITVTGAGSVNDVGTPAGNYLTLNLSEPAAVTGGLGTGQTTTVDFNLASFGTNNPTIFKYTHIIGKSSAGAEVFHILWRSGSNGGARQVYARELGQDNTNFVAVDPPVIRDGNELDYDFSSVDGTLIATGISFAINSTNTDVAPSGQVVVSVTIDENGWNASAAPTGGSVTETPATGLGIASGATDLASIEISTSNHSLNAGNNGFWIDNIVVATDQTVVGMPVLKGDVNLDGSVTFLDISPFIQILSSNGFQLEADCDCDGDVDFLDISPFIDILASTP